MDLEERKNQEQAARDWYKFLEQENSNIAQGDVQQCGDVRCRGTRGCPNPDHITMVSWFNFARKNRPVDDSSKWWEEGTKLSFKERLLLLAFKTLNNMVAMLIRWNNRIGRKLMELNVVVLEQNPLTFCSKDLIDFATQDSPPYGVQKQQYAWNGRASKPELFSVEKSM